ncbi:flagellin [Roseomonas elaeocarpi]|uniref:Flagellin n=1 Tax=Roseomonas elaeocarpi TaxID=907779 RepID=A0ABV6JTE7_9PROT
MSTVALNSGSAMLRVLAQSAELKSRLGDLTAQSGSGRLATTYGGESAEARQAISLRGEIARRTATGDSIGQAVGRADAAQTVLSRLSDIASSFAAKTGTLLNADDDALATAASDARDALTEIGSLLNSNYQGSYLFSGSDTGNEAVPNGDLTASGMSSAIQSAMAALASNGAAATLSATAAASTDTANSPFSSFLNGDGATEARPTTLLDDGTRVGTGVWANRNATAASTGSDSVGSWSLDLIRGLMTLAALPAASDAGASTADKQAVLASVRGGFTSAVNALAVDAGTLGQTQARLETAQDRHESVNTALSGQLSDIETVDMATTLTALKDTQTRLEASYQSISILSGLTLVDFLR